MKKVLLFFVVAMVVVSAGVLSQASTEPEVTPVTDEEVLECSVPLEQSEQGSDDLLLWTPIPFPIPPQTCGGNICGPGTYCCNPSCGTCTPFGAYCTQQVCAPTE